MPVGTHRLVELRKGAFDYFNSEIAWGILRFGIDWPKLTGLSEARLI
jgi:hypothetical protein